MVASGSFIIICPTNLLVGIHRRNFKRGMDKWFNFESYMDKALWALCDRAKRKDVLSLEVYNVVVKFFINNIQISPNMKDVVKRWLAQNSWESHPTHLLLESWVCCFSTWHTINATLSLLTSHVSMTSI
jgi:hypothetical protein